MAPSSSPHKLFPFRGILHRTEAPCHRVESSPPVKKYRSMVDIMARAKFAVIESPEEDDSDSSCVQCGSDDRPDELLLCDKCDRGFHMTCVRPVVVRVPIGPWFCPDCSAHPRVKSFSQKKIVDFFKLNKGGVVKRECSPASSLQDGKKRRKRSIVMKKKRRRLIPFIPVEDDNRLLEQMRSLASALTAHKIEFSNELTYCNGMAPRSANRAELENGGMQVLSREDTETMEMCLAMSAQGQFPPLLVVYDSLEGYAVEADSSIKDLTFLAEYTGDVDFIKNRERDDCDSMMTLLLANDSSDSLVICPDKRGNIARFISGINNHTPDGKKKQNVKCVRYNVNGECRVLLVSTRDIAKGERLYYDYNGMKDLNTQNPDPARISQYSYNLLLRSDGSKVQIHSFGPLSSFLSFILILLFCSSSAL